MPTESETVEQRADRIVRQEVRCCLSGLVSIVAEGVNSLLNRRGEPLSELCYQAQELVSPIDDYEEAAIQEGWIHPERQPDGQNIFTNATESEQNMTWCAKDWQALCYDFDIEPHQREVFEHWAVSEWLGHKLEAKGEKVDFDFAGLTVWARTCSGQGIACDGVIQEIAKDLLA